MEQDRPQEHVSSFVPQAYNMPRSYEAHRLSPAARTDHCKRKTNFSGIVALEPQSIYSDAWEQTSLK